MKLTPEQASNAVRARISGEWDHPDLMRIGALSTDTDKDIERIKAMRVVPEQKSYFNSPECQCPVCQKGPLMAEQAQMHEGETKLYVSCGNCTASWVEVYGFRRLENFEIDDSEEF